MVRTQPQTGKSIPFRRGLRVYQAGRNDAALGGAAALRRVHVSRQSDAMRAHRLRHGMRRDFNQWRASASAKPPPFKSLAELIAFNKANEATALPYGQDTLEAVEAENTPEDESQYGADRARDVRLAETEGLKAAMLLAQVDVLVMADLSGSEVAAIAGYPSIMVPAGKVSYTSEVLATVQEPAYPAGFEIVPVPWGVSFIGKPCDEEKLLKVAHQYELGSKAAGLARVPPPEVK